MTWFIIILILVLYFWLRHVFKVPRCGNMVLVTGGIKTGKSTLSVRMAYRKFRSQVLKTRFYNFLCKTIFRKKTPRPLPLLYSNIPLNVPYVPLTVAHIERKARFVYGSVVYICESSLLVDSQYFKDELTNERLLLFVKLFAHETKGGYCFYDTQSISDNHYAIKRCLSSYFYIHHTKKIPFFLLMYVREMKFSEDNSAVNVIESDIEDDLKIVIVPKKTWKLFDCYCYSVLTDDLPVGGTLSDPEELEDLKARSIVSFKEYKTIPKKFIKNGGNKDVKS